MINFGCSIRLFSVISILWGDTCLSDEKNTTKGFLDFNYYPYLSDVENDSVITINAAASLNKGFSYFSLTNFYGQSDTDSSETTNYYTEQNVRWKIQQSSFDLTLQMNFRSGEDNDRHRLGFRWRLNDTSYLQSAFDKLHLAWSVNFHLYQYDDSNTDAWQIEHAFRLTMPYISDRLYLGGFIDHTFNEDLPEDIPNNPIVAETQLGARVLENLYLIAESRINQYRRSDVNNVAVGLEYKLVW